MGETCGSPFQRRVVSGSMGTIFEQPVARVDNLMETLANLRAHGVRGLAAHPPPGVKTGRRGFARRLLPGVWRGGPGLTAPALAACDDTLEIPMPSHMNLPNVAGATAVFLYEATRQRG